MARSRPAPRFVLELALAYRGVHAWAGRRDSQLTLVRAGVLLLLGGARQRRTLGGLAAELGLGLPGASGLIDRMVDDGLIEKARDARDGRRWALGLTERGLAERRRAGKAARELNAALCEGFSDEELTVVSRWLKHAAQVSAREEALR